MSTTNSFRCLLFPSHFFLSSFSPFLFSLVFFFLHPLFRFPSFSTIILLFLFSLFFTLTVFLFSFFFSLSLRFFLVASLLPPFISLLSSPFHFYLFFHLFLSPTFSLSFPLCSYLFLFLAFLFIILLLFSFYSLLTFSHPSFISCFTISPPLSFLLLCHFFSASSALFGKTTSLSERNTREITPFCFL